ncbi:MAG TPA: tRNA (adenosine(37)-N6)-threonylcarbamoyltransferase complex dimerization subunit type 1 TsaB [Mycobacteriales bacterium]|nr:tRNA (adenosine(37)-N6)-threonylcarbamoyltransferase complex dimerization subunit type 1 TsaB [Mycobacteriales bacterium]
MLVLALDTSSPTVTVAVCEARDGGVRLRAERSETADNRHGERLAPLTALALRDAGVTPGQLEAVVVGLGPAPFTGLRVGIVTARAMSDALAIPAYGVCSLDGIAHRFTTDEGSFAVVADARRKQVYWGLYDETGRRIDGPELAPPDELAEQLQSRTTDVVGAGVLKYPEAFAGFTMREGDPSPRAVDLVWCVDFSQSPGDLAPLYLRRPDAQPPGRPKLVTPA